MTNTDIKPSLGFWSMSGKKQRFYLIPDDQELLIGDLVIESLNGKTQKVAAEAVERYEVTEAEALRWAREELGDSLDELKDAIDAKLADWQQKLEDFKNTPIEPGADVTPESATAFFDFLEELPQVFCDSVSGDEERVNSARKTAANLQERLKKAGFTSDERLKDFPDRLAEIKKRNGSRQNPPQKTTSE